MIVMGVMAIQFLEDILSTDPSVELLYEGAAIAIVAAVLLFLNLRVLKRD